MGISRRDFLIRGSLGAGSLALAHAIPGLLLSRRLAFASTRVGGDSGDHFFLMLRTFGSAGLDVTLGLDPQILPDGATESDMYLEYRPDDIITAAGLRLGPAAKSLVPHAGKLAIVNGVMMKRDAGHPACMLYMSTGKGDGTAPFMPVEIAATADSGPYGMLFNFDVYTGKRAVTLSAINDILGEAKKDPISDVLKPIRSSDDDQSPLEIARKGVVDSGPITQNLIQSLSDVEKNFPDIAKENHAVISAFLSGAACQATVDLDVGGQLDTHSDHPVNHLKYQTVFWQKVSDFLTQLEKTPFKNGSLLDRTTVMVITEFSRTPFLNASKGKDHNAYTNSILFAGKGIQGGQVFGSSKLIIAKKSSTGEAIHIGTPWDFKTNQPAQTRDGASFFFPENVTRTVAQIFGDPAGFSSVDLHTTLPIPGLAKA